MACGDSQEISRAVVELEMVNESSNRWIPNPVDVENRAAEDEGVLLTWEDVWVTVSTSKNSAKPLLQGITGYAKPGELLAVMGPSGCGKSTLLDALAGRLSSKTRQSGDILINGHKQTLAYGTSGLSGGQKRRVSICIEILTRPELLFLDEPTSGLDSAASYYVMSSIAALDVHSRRGGRRTVVASIHQPSSQVFQLFHSLCLLCSGKVIYFGQASAAYEFFASSGFACPPLQNPSDHYLRTINKDFEAQQDIEQGLLVGTVASVEEAIDTLILCYKASEDYKQVRRKVAEMCSSKQDCSGGMEKKRIRHAGFVTQCIVLSKRSFKNMYRDVGYYWLRLAIYIGLALGLGSIYYHIGYNTTSSIQARGSLIMFIASFLTFMAIGGFPSFVEDMKVFGRERLNGHYSATSFVVSNTLSCQPYLIMISVIPGVLSYYLPGLRHGFEHLLYFVVTLYTCILLVESQMMIVASLVPNFLIGIICGAGIQGLMILGGGFFRLPRDLPNPFWRYPLYYISFHKYAFQGMFKNEFDGLVLPGKVVGRAHSISGEEILRNTWQVEMGYSKWIDLVVLLGMVVFYRVLFLVIIKMTEKGITMASVFVVGKRNKPSMKIMENPIATPVHRGNNNNIVAM